MLSQAREPPGLWGRNGPPRRRPRMQNRRILFIGIVLCLFSAPLLRPCIYGTCSLWNAFHCMNGRITDRRPDPRAYRLSAAGFVSKASKPYAVDATGKSGCRIPVPPRIELVGELVAPSTALGLRQLLQVNCAMPSAGWILGRRRLEPRSASRPSGPGPYRRLERLRCARHARLRAIKLQAGF